MSWAAWWLEDAGACLEAREQAFRLYREAGDERGGARMALWIGDDHLEFHGASAVAEGWFGRASRLLSSVPPSAEHGWLAVFEAHSLLGAGDLAGAVKRAAEARELGSRCGAVDLEMFSLATEGHAMAQSGEVERGLRSLDEAAAAALAGEFGNLAPAAWTCCLILSVCEQVRDFERGAQWCRKVEEFSVRMGARFLTGVCRAHYAAILTWGGNWAEAERELARSVGDLSERRPYWRSEAVVRLADLRRRQGRLAEAEELLAAAASHPLSAPGLGALRPAARRAKTPCSASHRRGQLQTGPVTDGASYRRERATMEPLLEYKRSARDLWAAGDYDMMARTEGLYATGERLVHAAGISSADHVLDVACGTGNATLPAAAAGAMVTGLDLAPAMLATAAKRATDAGCTVAWQEGDAEDLPFGDGSFDVVLSAFGAMFAPRHEVAAGELARVLRPGGRLALANWVPEGSIAEFFATSAGFAEPAPDFASPPLLWGDPAHVRELFEGTGLDLEFRRAEVMMNAPSAADAVELYTTRFGPMAATRRATEADGRWPALRDALTAFFERHNTRDDRLAWPAPYLIVTGRKRR
jgi:SAM-dependent methyltransferase